MIFTVAVPTMKTTPYKNGKIVTIDGKNFIILLPSILKTIKYTDSINKGKRIIDNYLYSIGKN